MDRRLRMPHFSPLMGFNSRFFDDFEFDRPFHRPYWADQTMMSGHKIGEGIDVVDNEREYAVSVDVSQFEPEELKVNIIDSQLIIEGKHAEKTDRFGQVGVNNSENIYMYVKEINTFQVERHFLRKYNLPPSVKVDDVKSELSKEGVLTVRYEKKPEQQPRTIPITIQPKN
uniref:SHSP domain-containing protein n=1 Tax=Heterorhabditis bacteriophora TaxID=37862 RepID=A0A1I7XL12_HETBA